MQFDNIVNSILSEDEATKTDKLAALKTLKDIDVEVVANDKPHRSPYEYDIEYTEDFPQADVSDYVQDATSEEDLFIMRGTASVGYTIVPGQRGGWEDPSWDPYAETEGISWSGVKLIRSKSDGTEVVVDPYVLGVDLYNRIIRDLKAQAKDSAFEEADTYLQDSDNWG